MARVGLFDNLKFKRLIRATGWPRPYARGLLETMWEVGWQGSNPVIGNPDDVETAAEWPGTRGEYFAAIVADWLDEVEPGVFAIHDFWDHAPDYVKKRYQRERQKKGISCEIANIVEHGGQRRTTADNGRHVPTYPAPPRPAPPRPEGGVGGVPITTPNPTASDPRPVPASPSREPETPIAKSLAADAEVERRFARYSTDPNADEKDQETLRRVLGFLTTDRVTGRPLPARRRCQILDDLARFTPEVVFRACWTFESEGCIGSGKGHRYLVGICEGSATSETVEARAQREKRERHELRPKNRNTELDPRNPTPIGRLLVRSLRPGEGQ